MSEADLLERGSNYSLKDEISEYWSARSATFDNSPSHRIDDRFGMPEWHRLIRQACALAPGETLEGRPALDIACGTGEISRVLTGLGADVTAIDFSAAMLGRARTKLRDRQWRAYQADAENLGILPDGSFDLAVTRHLVWTLVDPMAAFAEWRRVLAPGGRLLIVDGDFTRKSPAMRLRHWLAGMLDGSPGRQPVDRGRHQAILSRVHYSGGLTEARARADLSAAGFVQIESLPLGRIYGRGMRGARLADRLRLSASGRFALCARVG